MTLQADGFKSNERTDARPESEVARIMWSGIFSQSHACDKNSPIFTPMQRRSQGRVGIRA